MAGNSGSEAQTVDPTMAGNGRQMSRKRLLDVTGMTAEDASLNVDTTTDLPPGVDEGEASDDRPAHVLPQGLLELLRLMLDEATGIRSRERALEEQMRVLTADFERRQRERDSQHEEELRRLKADHEKEKIDLQRSLSRAQKDVEYYHGKSNSLSAVIDKLRVVPGLMIPGDPSGGRRRDRPVLEDPSESHRSDRLQDSATVVPIDLGGRDANRLHKVANKAARLTTSVLCSIFEMEDIALGPSHENDESR